jgi:hypothetical protein
MKTLKLLGLAAGLTALAACGKNDESNIANADLNATGNMVVPVDNTAADLNADLNAGTTNDTNATDNSADNSVNAY